MSEVCKQSCQGHENLCTNNGIRRRCNTKYIDDELNYMVLCDDCFESVQAYWADMWSDYYADCM